ncbi:hypothetical protein [Idiomarina xiamenensis]|uniref:Uncharacterized protein n=1 Tax=Idiomarina xiamenensis 10-D-4 TaxID=740709 RepID=K2KHG3_9GAMM|nr:hypothetical protein [Idiomarina xiamenensis]EKE82104.1 hypothetical protein A10D4_10014 [Idiomarina xiamenensis 10-D-4]
MLRSLALIGTLITTALPTWAQPVPESVATLLKQQFSQQMQANLYFDELSYNLQRASVSANDVRIETRIKQLSEPLNQAIIAEQLSFTGSLEALTQQQILIHDATIKNGQLTIAYYQTGRSNLHDLLQRVGQLHQRNGQNLSSQRDDSRLSWQRVAWQQPTADASVAWQIERLVFDNVTVNLFDQEKPILSVKLPQLIFDDLGSEQTPEQHIQAVLWPIINSVAKSVWAGDENVIAVDKTALMKFLWREAG